MPKQFYGRMMNKPKTGLYIKRHERERRQAQLTPRSTDGLGEYSPRSMEGGDSEGYISDVMVESYGEGHISGIQFSVFFRFKFELRRSTSCLQGFRQGLTQTGLYNYKRWPEA